MVTKKKKAEKARARNERANKEIKAQKAAERGDEIEEIVEEDVVEEDPQEEEEYVPKLHTISEIVVAVISCACVFLSPFITLVGGSIVIGLNNLDKQDYGDDYPPKWPRTLGIAVIGVAILGWVFVLI